MQVNRAIESVGLHYKDRHDQTFYMDRNVDIDLDLLRN